MHSTSAIMRISFIAVVISSSQALAKDKRELFEVRAGMFLHDPLSPEKGSVDGNLEILTPRLPIGLSKSYQFLVPRPHLGVTLNAANKTSEAYMGLSWGFNLTDKIIGEASFGGAVNNGKTAATSIPGHNPLGCATSFRESGSIGYQISSAVAIMATIEHISNAGLCVRNRGLTNGGIRIGYSF